MPRSDTMTTPGNRHTAAIAALLFITGSGLAFIAGDTAKTFHDYPAGIGMGALALVLLGAGLVLTVPHIRRAGRPAGWLPPIEPSPLPDDLYDVAADLADGFLGLDVFDARDLHAAALMSLDSDAVAARICALNNTLQALVDSERYSPHIQSTYAALIGGCAPAADAYVATLASDLIVPHDWAVLTAFYRDRELRPCLPVQAETRFN